MQDFASTYLKDLSLEKIDLEFSKREKCLENLTKF